MHRFVSAIAVRPLTGFSGRPAAAIFSGGAIATRGTKAVLAGLLGLFAVACGAVLWLALGGAPRTPSSDGPSTTVAEPLSVSQPAWLEPLSAPLRLAGGGAESAGSLPTGSAQAAKDTYAKLPLSFVPNAGQTDKRVRYYAQAQGVGFYFTRDKVVLSFTKGERGAALHLRPLGASPRARLVAGHPGPGKANYLLGSERYTNLPTYHELRYRELWPGIDLVFRGQGGRLKYEFRVAPGADPGQIRLAYRGAGGLAVGRAGGLRVRTPVGTLRDARPRSDQHIGGKRVPVASRFVLEPGASTYGFALGASYDPRRPLVIDPALVYSTFLGGGAADQGNAVAVDANGNAYVTGDTRLSTFPTTVGAFDATFNGSVDAFVTKLNPAGSGLVYSTYLGGANGDAGHGIAVDSSGSAYVTGSTDSPDFPTTAGAFDRTFDGGFRIGGDAFVAKLNAAGSALVYSTFLGGTSGDEGLDVAVDGVGSAYVVGAPAPDFPTTTGAFDTIAEGDAFVTKLNPAGSLLVYSTGLGGASSSEFADAVAIDDSGNAYVTGETFSSDFPTTVGALDRSFNGGQFDTFVTKLNPAGSALAYSSFLGGGSYEFGNDIATDASRNAYLTGFANSSNFPTTAGAFDTTLDRPDEAFVAKLNPAGSALAYSTFLSRASGVAIAVDARGSASVTGVTSASDFPTTVGALDRTGGGQDAFVTKLNAVGSALAYSTYLGGASFEFGSGIAADASGALYVTGYTGSIDFPVTPGAFDVGFNGGSQDAFITKLNLNQCSDGRDNDSDGKVDFPADPGCSSAFDDDERDPRRFPTNQEQCKNGGWRTFPGFKNQGDCVSFVATGGKNEPAGPKR